MKEALSRHLVHEEESKADGDGLPEPAAPVPGRGILQQGSLFITGTNVTTKVS